MQNSRISGTSKPSHLGLARRLCKTSSRQAVVASPVATPPPPQRLTVRRPVWLRYLVAIGCVLCALGTRLLLAPVLGDELPFLLLIAAALVAAWYGGDVPGGASLVLGL